MTPGLIALPFLIGGVWLLLALRKRHVSLWLPAYLSGDWPGRRERRTARGRLTHILLCVADHYEPGVLNPGMEVEHRRVEHWLREYPASCEGFRDADGRPPQHTFFFPAEQYRPEHLDRLGELVQRGFGEVEIHLHHHNDTSENLRSTLEAFKTRLRSHGHLGTERATGRVRFGFVHGNWCLDNSMPDGSWCGVNDEIRLLAESGCYADFTFPAAPSPTQTRRINSIYYAKDDPARPRSHDDGTLVKAGGAVWGDLMLIQGPLAVLWPGGRFGLLPRLEVGKLDGGVAPTPRRLATWLQTRVCVSGRPDWIVVKLYAHGCLERNWPGLFGAPMAELRRHLHEQYNDGQRYALHYVTAREVYNIVKAAERGLDGDPGEYRDLEIAPAPESRVDPQGALCRNRVSAWRS